MEGIGQVLARRGASPGPSELPRSVPTFPLDKPSEAAAPKCPTSAGTTADAFRSAGLLGLESLAAPRGSGPEKPAPEEASETSSTPGESVTKGAPAAFSTGSLSSSAPAMEAALLKGAAAVDSLRSMAAHEAGLFGFVEAADFAGKVEEISRSLEYLQLVAAQAVERTRKE
ncbi:HNH endonuclease, partial [Paenarthrobacter nitroguajacolicus]